MKRHKFIIWQTMNLECTIELQLLTRKFDCITKYRKEKNVYLNSLKSENAHYLA